MECARKTSRFNVRFDGVTDVAFKAVVLTFIILGTSTSLFSYAAFGLVLVYLLVSNNEYCVNCMFFLLPFANIFKPSPSESSLFTYLTIILALRLLLQKRYIEKRFVIAWLALLMFQILGSNMNLSLIIKQAAVLLLVYGFFHCCETDPKQLVFNLAIGVLISCVVANMTDILPGLPSYLRTVYAYEISMAVYRFTGLYSDPNYLSKTLILLCTSFFVLIQKKEISSRCWILVALLVAFGTQTISKSFYLMLIVMVVLFSVIAVKNRRYSVLVAIFLICVVAALLFLSGKLSVFDDVMKRFSASDDVTTGRTAIWKMYLDAIVSSPLNLLFGFGIGHALNYMAHNTYIDFLYYYGIFGSLIYVVGLDYAFGKNIRYNGIMNWAPAISVMIVVFFLSNLLMFDFSFDLILILSFVAQDSDLQVNKLTEENYDNSSCSRV